MEFASAHLEESGRVIELVRENAHAMHICRTYHISYIHTNVSPSLNQILICLLSRLIIHMVPQGPYRLCMICSFALFWAAT